MLLTVHGLSALLMMMGPLMVAAVLLRRLKGSWRLFWAGGAIFMLSQVVHIPLNAIVAQLFVTGALPMPPEGARSVLLALGLGLSAGLCEELARYIGLTRVLKRARSWGAGVNLGLGHGGAEAMILGALSLLTLVQMITIQQSGLEALGVPEEQLAQVQAQVDQYWEQNPLMPLVGVVERVGAMCAHVCMNVLVMRAVMTGEKRWLVASIGWHTALNAGAVLLLPYGAAAAEGWVLLMAAAAVAATLAMRQSMTPPPDAPGGAVEPLSVSRVSIEDAAERVE